MRGRRRRPVLAAVAVAMALAATAPGGAQVVTPCGLGAMGDYDDGSYPKVSSPALYSIAPQQIVELDSDVDGATIQMAIFRPNVPAGTTVPVIANAGVYYHALQTLDLRACVPFLTENFVGQGYAVAVIAIRGTGDSGGCMNMMGPKERADLNQAVTWLGTQPWSNGSVGMFGLSYDGATQWEVASFGNQYLKTIVPVSGVPDLYDLQYGQGRTDWRGPGLLNGIYYVQTIVSFSIGRSPQHTIDAIACPEYVTGIAASLYSATYATPDPYGFWDARRYRDEILENYRGSVYLVQGLQDWNVNPGLQYPWIWELEARGVPVKHTLGQWGHAWPYSDGGRDDWADVLLAWFDRWLKDDAGADIGPTYEIEDSTGRWRAADAWPDGSAATLWLNSGNALSTTASNASSSKLLLVDPFHTAATDQIDLPDALGKFCLPGCARFETTPFAAETRFGGLPEADLAVTPLGPGGQLAVYVYERTGSKVRQLGWGQVDLRFRDGGDEPQAVDPGRTYQIRFTLQPLDVVIHKGSRLVVIVSEGTAWNRLPTVPNYPMKLGVGGGASSVTFTTVEPAPEDFFPG